MKLWLDDERPMPPGYDVHVKTAREAIIFIKKHDVTEVSLDHDLGPIENCGTGYDVACFIEEQVVYEDKAPPKWNLHTANPVGRKAMRMALTQADRLWDKTKKEG